jgi:sec-independent protein translocase protein TatA
VLLLFGRGKISGLMGEVAGGIKAFRKGMAEEETPDDKPVATIDQKPGQAEPTLNQTKDAERSKDV